MTKKNSLNRRQFFTGAAVVSAIGAVGAGAILSQLDMGQS
jgi:nitrous oxide reductase